MSAARTLGVVAAVGAATTGGVLFGFSTFVMRALDDLEPPAAIRAMQAINRHAPNPWFMAVMFGSAAFAVAATVAAGRGGDASLRVLVGATGIYLLGLVVTVVYHVPRNDALAAVDASSSGAAATWAHYAGGWTLMNHVRTATSLTAAAGFVLATLPT